MKPVFVHLSSNPFAKLFSFQSRVILQVIFARAPVKLPLDDRMSAQFRICNHINHNLIEHVLQSNITLPSVQPLGAVLQVLRLTVLITLHRFLSMKSTNMAVCKVTLEKQVANP